MEILMFVTRKMNFHPQNMFSWKDFQKMRGEMSSQETIRKPTSSWENITPYSFGLWSQWWWGLTPHLTSLFCPLHFLYSAALTFSLSPEPSRHAPISGLPSMLFLCLGCSSPKDSHVMFSHILWVFGQILPFLWGLVWPSYLNVNALLQPWLYCYFFFCKSIIIFHGIHFINCLFFPALLPLEMRVGTFVGFVKCIPRV